MKAIVLEVKENIAAVMKEDGTVVRIPYAGRAGDTVDVPEKVSFFESKKARILVRVCAAAAVLILAFGGIFAYQNILPGSYVTVDVNPSIEYTLNRSERVLSASALNTEAEGVVEKLNASGVMNGTISDALSKTMDILTEDGYLGKDENYMLVSVSSPSVRAAQTLAASVEQTVAAKDESVSLDVVTASLNDRAAAKDYGISTGRYALIREIKKADTTVSTASSDSQQPAVEPADISDYKDKSVKELMVDSGWQKDGTQPSSGSNTGSTPASGTGSSTDSSADSAANPNGTASSGTGSSGSSAGTDSVLNPGSTSVPDGTGSTPAAGTESGSRPGTNSGTKPGSSQGGTGGSTDSTASGTDQSGSGTDSSQNPGTDSNVNPGGTSNPGTNPGTDSNVNPGGTSDPSTNPDSGNTSDPGTDSGTHSSAQNPFTDSGDGFSSPGTGGDTSTAVPDSTDTWGDDADNGIPSDTAGDADTAGSADTASQTETGGTSGSGVFNDNNVWAD